MQGEAQPTSGGGIIAKLGGVGTIKNKEKGAMQPWDESSPKIEEGEETRRMVKEKGGGMLGAIGETIVEIAQHTTELVAGPTPRVEVREREEHHESK